ncbi:MAG: nitroreductase family protein, partial [bacterium]
NEGLGACWMTGPLIAKQEIEKILEIDKPDNLVALIPIGNKIERQSKTARKDISEIIRIIE